MIPIENINLAEHCRNCENQIVHFTSGTVCGVSNRKPAFLKSCPKIKWGEKLEANIIDINVTIKELEATKPSVMFKFWSQVVAGVAVVFAGIYLLQMGLLHGIFATLPFIIMAAGFSAFPIGFYSLMKHKSAYSAASSKKEKLDSILELYNVEYDLKIELGKEIHGVFIPKTNLTVLHNKIPMNRGEASS